MDSNREDSTSKRDSNRSKNFEKRFLHLLDNNIDCDCEFVVGTRNIIVKGHKFLFSAASDVFHAMFYGDLKEEKTVRIKDLEPEGFQGMRQFIYTGEVDFTSAIHALLIYIAARKYLIPALTEKCVSHLEGNNNIQSSEVLEFYEICKANNIAEFEESCYEIIQQKTDEVVLKEYFLLIKPETMELILKSPSLRLESEVDVLVHFEKWVIAEAERQGVGVAKIMSGSIKNMKKHIRFLTIGSNDYFFKVASSPLLTPDEKIAIACNLKVSDSIPIPESLSLERKHRNFIPFPISELGAYNHSHEFVVNLLSIEEPPSSFNQYKMELAEDFFSSTIVYTKIIEYICFLVDISTDNEYDTTELLTMKSKLRVVGEKSDYLLFENEIKIMLDWNENRQFKSVFAKIPISKIRNVLLENTDTVVIQGSFSMILESEVGDPLLVL